MTWWSGEEYQGLPSTFDCFDDGCFFSKEKTCEPGEGAAA
jgi:hypothetical protein